jgi:hypothetical protein
MMINRRRGEVPLRLDGEEFRLCLTLGALAEIESGLGLADLRELDARLARPSIEDIIVILTALMRGGGHDIEIAAVRARSPDLRAVGKAIADAFSASGLGQEQGQG